MFSKIFEKLHLEIMKQVGLYSVFYSIFISKEEIIREIVVTEYCVSLNELNITVPSLNFKDRNLAQ